MQALILNLTFKVLHNETPAYIANLFNWYTPARTLRSASLLTIINHHFGPVEVCGVFSVGDLYIYHCNNPIS